MLFFGQIYSFRKIFLLDKKGLMIFQKRLLSVMFFSFKFSK